MAAAVNRIARILAIVCCVVEVGFVALFSFYALVLADANHTGLPITWVRDFALIAGVASVGWIAVGKRDIVPRRLAWCLLIASVLALLNIEGFERFNVMMEYDTWARKGMPARP